MLTQETVKAQSLHSRLRKYQDSGDLYFSLELMPLKDVDDYTSFVESVMELFAFRPLFVGFSSHDSPFAARSLKVQAIGDVLQGCGVDLLHTMRRASTSREEAVAVLNQLRLGGRRNILVVRGDDCREGDAREFIAFIRQLHGDHFTLACAGYPAGHPRSVSLTQDLEWLKSKVDAGADFILTQFFFDAQDFRAFVERSRWIGIEAPIVPGILLADTSNIVYRLCSLTGVRLPETVLETLRQFEECPETVRRYMVFNARNICTQLLRLGLATGFHIFSLNSLQSCRDLLVSLGFASGISTDVHFLRVIRRALGRRRKHASIIA